MPRNYTDEQTKILESEYDGSADSISVLAEKLGKSERSIIGKLAKMGVYQKQSYKNKLGEDPVKKIEMVSEIAMLVGVDTEEIEGIEKSDKRHLKRLLEALKVTLNVE